MASHDPLLEPFQLKHLTLRNRILSTSHAPAYVEDGKPQERYQLYHEAKARGGIALTMFGGSSNIAPDSPSVFGQIYIGDDSVIPHFQAFAERIHRQGAALMCQITHMGRRTTWQSGNWLPVIAPSRQREPAHRAFPREMDGDDIARVVAAYAAAARRCKEGGLDGCEVLVHGHLPGQFWSPLVNRRSDGYGGSLANRARFSLELLAAMRAAVGEDFILGFRVGGDERIEGDLSPEESLEIIGLHVETGQLDFLNVNAGSIESDRALAHMMPGMAAPSAPHLDVAASYKRAFELPIFHACRVNDTATARHALREGLVDMIGMTRAHIADPRIVAKIAAGEETRIRPCVGAAYCIDRIYQGGEALCIHNAATGREAQMPHVIAPSEGPPRKVVVVGGGPAGMEAARVSAERGHAVVLFEAGNRLGGQILLAAKTDWRRDLIGIADWLAAELEQLGVELRLNRYAEPEDVLAESPDIVVIASGGLPDLDCVEGGEHCVSVWDILSGQVQPSPSVLLFDDNGAHQGPSCADYLSDQGVRVELVTPDRMAGFEIGGLNYPIYLENFYRKGVTLTPDRRLIRVERSGNKLRALLRNEYSDAEEERLVDQVVVEHGTIPVEEVFTGLQARAANGGRLDVERFAANRPQPEIEAADGSFLLYRVGDALASRNIHAAIYDSLRLCKDF